MLTAQNKIDRRLGCGGSDAPVICGLLEKYGKTPKMLWEQKCGLREPDPDNEQQYWGNMIEPLIAETLRVRHEWDVVYPMTARVNEHYQFMRCNPDAFGAPKHRVYHGCVEFKNTRFLTKDGPRDYQEVQIMHNLEVCGMTWGALVILVGGCELKIFEYERDAEIIEPLIELERRFWQRVIEKEWRDDWQTAR